jgi:DNA-binding transcriptional regulator YbjK
MPGPNDQARHRGELVAAAGDVIARKGLGAVRLRDVAEAAGMTSGNVLYYYEGLDGPSPSARRRAPS